MTLNELLVKYQNELERQIYVYRKFRSDLTPDQLSAVRYTLGIMKEFPESEWLLGFIQGTLVTIEAYSFAEMLEDKESLGTNS